MTLLFYVVYAIVAKTMGKREIEFTDFKDFDIDIITDKIIETLSNEIYKKYKEAGGNGRVAKSTEFIKKIDEILNQQAIAV